jgi:hypothetical protein
VPVSALSLLALLVVSLLGFNSTHSFKKEKILTAHGQTELATASARPTSSSYRSRHFYSRHNGKVLDSTKQKHTSFFNPNTFTGPFTAFIDQPPYPDILSRTKATSRTAPLP